MKARSARQAARFFFLAAVLFAAGPVFAEASFDKSKLTQYIQYDFSKNADLGAEPEASFGGVSYGMKYSDHAEIWTGFRASTESTDFTISDCWWPLSFSENRAVRIQFGLREIYHFLDFGRYCSEHDVLFDPVMRFRGKTWTFEGAFGCGFKASRIKAVDFWTKNWYIDYSFNAVRYFKCGAEIYAGLESHDRYRYNLFPSSFWVFGAAYTFDQKLRLDFDYTIHGGDQWVSKVYINGRAYSLGVRMIF